jgi:hypothetical protein
VEEKDVRNFRKTHLAHENQKWEFAGVEVDSFRIVVDGAECEVSGRTLEDAESRPVRKETLKFLFVNDPITSCGGFLVPIGSINDQERWGMLMTQIRGDP